MGKSEESSDLKNGGNVEVRQSNLAIASGLFILFILLLIPTLLTLFIFNVEQWSELLQKKVEYTIKTWTIAGLIFGGIVGAINVYFGAKRTFAMEKSAEAANKTAEAANKNAEAALKNLQLSEDKQITERFSKAIEQLGSEKIEVRLGAIYTLERIAKDSPKDHWTIMEVLTAFIRENAPLTEDEEFPNVKIFNNNSNNQEEKKELKKLRLDIQETLTVIARRNYENDLEYQRLILSNINIVEVNLYKANLKGANLKGANLKGANLIAADLRGADLTGANLTGANLLETRLTEADLAGANFAGASLTETDLRGAYLYTANLKGANLTAADLRGACLTGANFTEADFTNNKTIEPNQIKYNTRNWEKAKYDKDFREKLGLLPEDTEKVARF
jgi:uncharacterized protein YjbI with pentapeptide repeats